MRRLFDRRPLIFCVGLTVALFVLTAMSRFSLPRSPIANPGRLPERAFEPPIGLDRIVADLRSPDVLFWGMTILLSAGLLAWTGYWREAGFNRPVVRNLQLLWFPFFVCVLTLSGGVFVAGIDDLLSAYLVVLVAVFGQELVFRGLMWRALVPGGPFGAMVVTAMLAGVVVFGRSFTDGPWPEAVRVTSLTVCSAFTYAALRWRTRSIWPVILANVAFTFSVDIAALGTISYRILMLVGTLGFVAYGIFLLCDSQTRADGGIAPQPKTPRVR